MRHKIKNWHKYQLPNLVSLFVNQGIFCRFTFAEVAEAKLDGRSITIVDHTNRIAKRQMIFAYARSWKQKSEESIWRLDCNSRVVLDIQNFLTLFVGVNKSWLSCRYEIPSRIAFCWGNHVIFETVFENFER